MDMPVTLTPAARLAPGDEFRGVCSWQPIPAWAHGMRLVRLFGTVRREVRGLSLEELARRVNLE